MKTRTQRVWPLLRVAVSLGVLLIVARALDISQIAARLRNLEAGWVVAGLAISLLQVGLQAWRWRYTASRLAIDLPIRAAVAEYYMGLLLNQLLPGGVAGDVSRAWRHARTDAPTGPAVRAVVLERASAQVVMSGVAVVSLFLLPFPWVGARLRLLALVIGAFAAVGVLVQVLKASPADSWMATTWRDTHRAVLARDAWPIQFASAALLVASFIAVYGIAARAVGVDTSTVVLLPLVAPVLMTMLVPVSIAGWGVREGTAALLWGMVGLSPEDGVAISVTYGLIVLVSSLPGLVVLTAAVSSGRNRTARLHPSESADRPADAPRPDSQSSAE